MSSVSGSLTSAAGAAAISADDFERIAAESEERLELVDGEIHRMAPTGIDHGFSTGDLHTTIGIHLREHKLGRIASAETGFKLRRPGEDAPPPEVRGPDIAVVLKERLPAGPAPSFGQFVPHLVVETLSPSDRASAALAKMRWWFEVGVSEVWHLDPESRTLTRHHPDGTARIYHQKERFSGSAVLPKLTFPLGEVFSGP